MTHDEVPLPGGDVTRGVVRIGDTVRRPTGPHSPFVHAVLRHLEAVGFDGAPRLLDVDAQGREVLTFVDGDVAHQPYPAVVLEEDTLASVARLLRRFDEAMVGFVPPPGVVHHPPAPGEAVPAGDFVGHRDVTIENVVRRGREAVALLDLDLAAPATRVTEVVNALQWWAPLRHPDDRDPVHRGLDVARRCRVFTDAYGLDDAERAALVSTAIEVGRRSVVTMRRRAELLGGGWARLWDDGIGDVITRRVRWLESDGDQIAAALRH